MANKKPAKKTSASPDRKQSLADLWDDTDSSEASNNLPEGEHEVRIDSMVLKEDKKKAIINDAVTFFDSQDTYEKLKVPWKRGIIYYGPPGNGKTISIKAMM